MTGELKVPVYGESEGHDVKVAYSDDFTELTADAGKFTSVDLKGYLVGALTLIGRKLKTNAMFNVTDFIVNYMAEEIASFLEGELLNGTPSKMEGALSTTNEKTAAAAAAGRSPPPPAVPTRQERHPARCLPTPCGHGPSEKPVHTRVHSDRGIVAENTPNGFPQFSQNMSEYSESFKYSDNSGNCKIWTAANYLRLRVDSTPQGILSPLRGAQAQKRQDRSCGSCL